MLHGVKGMVVLSGYHAPLCERLYGAWAHEERETIADQAKPRPEVVWLNPACVAALARDRERLSLLEA